MARIRTIKPEFFSHEDLASKSAHARLLAIGLLTIADCEGRMRWVPMQIHSQVFPWEAEVKIQVLLGELLDCGYVVHYEVDGKRYVEICNFKKHQRLSGKESSYASRIPPPPKNPTISLSEHGEIPGKHPDASLGSSGNPLGTGEHRNIGTEEYIKKEKGDSAKCAYLENDEFREVADSFRKARTAKHGIVSEQVVEAWYYDLTRFPLGEAIAILRFSTACEAKKPITNGDHARPPPAVRNGSHKVKNNQDKLNAIFESQGL